MTCCSEKTAGRLPLPVLFEDGLTHPAQILLILHWPLLPVEQSLGPRRRHLTGFIGPMYFVAITTLSMYRCWSYGDGFVPP